jgi:glycosyltransferase involved in cell wall biosynthesis
MPLAFITFGIATALEISIWTPLFWGLRRILAGVSVILVSISSGLIVGNQVKLWAILVFIISLYRLINLLRLVEGRTQAGYLYRVARKGSYYMIGAQAFILLAAYIDRNGLMSVPHFWTSIAGFQIIAAIIVLASTVRHLKTTRPLSVSGAFADRDLPSITVAIPARNETDDLEDCLQSLVQSNYPKLEILVLDDCSQNRQTPEIIRGFAQEGIRFIAGKEPPEQWVPKTYAYQQLVDESNGEWLLFCGVDTRYEPDSLRFMVDTVLSRNKQMASFLPTNLAPHGKEILGFLVQPGRYAWEVSLPRRLVNRPGVLSTCWLISKQSLDAAGGFKAVRRNHTPESYFARYTATHGDSYSFLQSDKSVGLSSAKNASEQRATAVRTRYPQTHRRPEIVLGLSLLELTVLVGPFVLLISGIITKTWQVALIASIAAVLVTIVYSLITRLTYRRFMWSGLWLLPLAAVFDICLLNYSMWQYEFGEVLWKGRNVCVPIMRITKKLPSLQ